MTHISSLRKTDFPTPVKFYCYQFMGSSRYKSDMLQFRGFSSLGVLCLLAIGRGFCVCVCIQPFYSCIFRSYIYCSCICSVCAVYWMYNGRSISVNQGIMWASTGDQCTNVKQLFAPHIHNLVGLAQKESQSLLLPV